MVDGGKYHEMVDGDGGLRWWMVDGDGGWSRPYHVGPEIHPPYNISHHEIQPPSIPSTHHHACVHHATITIATMFEP